MGTNWRIAVLGAALAVLAAACGNAPDDGAADSGGGAAAEDGGEALSGAIEIDGSSTVAPLTDAVAEEYNDEQPDVRVNVGVSGTGGGFERFCAGETDISDASRPIKPEEAALCEEAGVEFTELKVGTDALTVVTNPEADFVDCLTVDELATIFGPEDPATTWQQVRAEFPDAPLEVFAPGTDSGTYDFMVEDVLGLEESRQDYSAAEDDNIIAQGVIGTPNAWGFFGFAYYQENQDQVKALALDGGNGCVAPSVETAQDGSYPATRPLFIYVNNESLQRPEVADFVGYYLDNVQSLITDIGYVPETEAAINDAKQAFEAATQ